MTPTGITPSNVSLPSGSPAIPPTPFVPTATLGAGFQLEGQASIDAREAAKAAAEKANNSPEIQGLAGHVRQQWSVALQAKRQTVEPRMFQAMRQRRGEYDPEVLTEIQKTGGSEIYMMVTSAKCRSASALIKDVMLGTKNEKPWTISPTPLPDLPPDMADEIAAHAVQEAKEIEAATGAQVQQSDMNKIVAYVKDRIIAEARTRANEMCARMEDKMEDQLVEGNFSTALGNFIEDLVTFPAAVLKGPIVRKQPRLRWVQKAQEMQVTPADPSSPQSPPKPQWDCVVEDQLTLSWERVDPFMIYPMPHCTDVRDGGIVERHKMLRTALYELRDVEGYSKDAIDQVLEQYGRNGLSDWLYVDTMKAQVEGKSVASIAQNTDGLIDALQYWGSVQGKLLIEWGMDKKAIPDELKDYNCEVWLIGNWVIKAMLNPDPMGRKPYYKASYEEVPGTFWGNSVTDLCRDAQSQCNTAARAMANNMGIASGPQVSINVDRLPAGEDITQMYPWKITQTTSDPYGSSADPVKFFQPASIAGELMQIYQFYSVQADEQTGIPRYMTGDTSAGGAGRTASGMSMMLGNAGKAIKQVVGNIDSALQLLLERLFYYNMKYGDDPDLKGDINIVARGANAMMVKENAQVRRNEFLQLALNNDTVKQIVGEEAIAAILRENVKTLDMDVDKIIPRPEIIRARVFQQQQAAAAAQKAAQDFQMAMSLAPSHEITMERGPNGEMLGMKVTDKQPHVMPQPGVAGPQGGPQGGNPAQTMSSPGQNLQNGQQIADNFSPQRVH